MPSSVVRRLQTVIDLSPAVERVADYVRAHTRECLTQTADEIANEAQVSPSVVIRFVKELGFRGMQEFRVTLAAEMGTQAPSIYEQAAQQIAGGRGLVRTVLGEAAQALLDTAEIVSDATVEEVASRLIAARRSEIYGVGASGFVAEDAAHKLMRLNVPATAMSDPHIQPIYASQLTAADVAIAVSYSGRTADTVDVATIAKESGAYVVALTSAPSSPLARIADALLLVPAVDAPDTLGVFTARLLQIAVLDAVTVAIAMKEPGRLAALRSRTRLLSHRKGR